MANHAQITIIVKDIIIEANNMIDDEDDIVLTFARGESGSGGERSAVMQQSTNDE